MSEQVEQAIEAMEARIDAIARKLDVACETPSVCAGLETLARIETEIAAGEERLSVIAQQETVLAQRTAVLDERERAIKIREFQFEQKVEEATGQLRASYASLVASDNAMKMRILNYAGMLSGFNPTLAELPSWPALERMLGVTDAIPEMQDKPTVLTREGFAGDQFAPSTLTRSMPTPMADMASHDLLPTPRPPPNKRPSRRGWRAAYKHALQSP